MMFASIQSKDIPWRAGQKVTTTTAHDAEHDYTLVMRDFRQHNEPNPYLVYARAHIRDDHSPDPLGNLISWLDRDPAGIIWCGLHETVAAARPHIDHARRVLTRLAALTKEQA